MTVVANALQPIARIPAQVSRYLFICKRDNLICFEFGMFNFKGVDYAESLIDMASAGDLVEPVVFAADATLAGGARAEICVRLLNAESSSSQPEASDHWRCR